MFSNFDISKYIVDTSVIWLIMNGVQASLPPTPGQCRYCGKKIKRKDNLRTHEQQTCQKDKILCVCGKLIRKSSLSRHTNKYKCNEATHVPENDVEPTQSASYTLKITTEVSITNNDGVMTYQHEPIFINGVEMLIVPAVSVNITSGN